MNTSSTPLKFLAPGWFVLVMGLCGLALAWLRAAPLFGELAGAGALVLAGLAATVAVVLAVLSFIRWRRYPQAWAEDLKHPVRHVMVAAMPVSLILLATVGTALIGPDPWLGGLWALGSAWQFAVTVWVLGRWLRPGVSGPAFWAGVTPALFVPVVGNVVTGLAGPALGFGTWAQLQFGVGLFLWPVVLSLLVVRLAVSGIWPERLLPTTFITVAPPAVIGLDALQFGAPPIWAWMAWGIALFFLLWSATTVRRMLDQPFGLMFWGLSFPLAAFAALGLRLTAHASGSFQTVVLLSLALATLVIVWLILATVKGLREGSLLAPEPVASMQVAPAQS